MQQAIIFRADERHPSEREYETNLRFIDNFDSLSAEIEAGDRRISLRLSGEDITRIRAFLEAFCRGNGVRPSEIQFRTTPEMLLRIRERGEPYALGIEFYIPETGMKRFVVKAEAHQLKDALDATIRAQEEAFQVLEHAVFLARDRQIENTARLRECLIEEGTNAALADRAIQLWVQYVKDQARGGN